uniref:Uncharacterized protein n=1 Tax=Anguilla anguilla TaxID=7936 RepID=A0A0E9PG27_ANGAN
MLVCCTWREAKGYSNDL